MALALQPVIAILTFYYATRMADFSEDASVSYQPALGILLVNVVLYFLAYRGIKKDDALVRSADRLR